MADLPIGWNNFTWWMSDQKYQTQSWRYYKWHAIDTQRYDVTPMNSWKLSNTYLSDINAIFNVSWYSTDNKNVVWLDNWEIWYNNTKQHTILASSTKWYRIWVMRPSWWSVYKLYYFNDAPPSTSTKYIHRSNIEWDWFNENYLSYTSTDWNTFVVPPSWMIVLSEWRRILFSYYNEIWQLSNTEVLTKLVSLRPEENIVWITQFLWEYKIYTTIWFNTSKIYKWDWLSDTPDISVDLNWLAILWWVSSLWAFDYMVADNSLFKVSWVQYQKLYDGIINWKILTAFDGKVYIEILQDDNYKILEFSDKPWYIEWLHPKNVVDIINPLNWVTAVTYNSSWLIYASKKKLYANWTIETWSTIPSIESMVYVWSNIQYEKILKELIFKFSWFTTTNIIIYAQINESWTWVKLFEWNNNTISTTNHWLKIPANILTNALWKFNTIRFKIEMPHNWQAQWKFYGLDWILTEDVWK